MTGSSVLMAFPPEIHPLSCERMRIVLTAQHLRSVISWIMCVIAGQHEEASAVWWNRIRLDLQSRIWDNHWVYEHGHNRRNVCTMGRLQQLCCREDNGFLGPFLYISDANGCNDLLLLQNRLHHKTQSICPTFAVSGPTIWNTLPSTLRVSTTTLGQFQSGLKTILFCLAYGTWLGAFLTV